LKISANFAKAQRVTINSFVQLAWANILSRYSGESNVIYGSVLSGRSHNIFGIDKMVGLLINTLPMSINIDADKSVSENLEQVHQTVQEVNSFPVRGFKERGIKKVVAELYGVKVGYSESDGKTIRFHYYPITNKSKDEVFSENIWEKIEVENTSEDLLPFLITIPLQKLAYYSALKKGYDIDKPRNLAKSVTVE